MLRTIVACLGLPSRKTLVYLTLTDTLDPAGTLDNEKEESRCSLGIPDTSFKGLRTRTARRVRRSTWVLKWVPAVARMLWAETQKSQGYHSLSGPSCFMGRLGRAGSAWKVHKASASCMWAHLSLAESPVVSSGIKYSHLGFTVQRSYHHTGVLIPNHEQNAPSPT